MGGKGLDGAGQQYLYFLVRQDGSYLIKRRDGEKTSDVSKGWVPSEAVKKPDAKGSATNLLEVDNKRDPGRVAFLVNGKEVYATDAKAMASTASSASGRTTTSTCTSRDSTSTAERRANQREGGASSRMRSTCTCGVAGMGVRSWARARATASSS